MLGGALDDALGALGALSLELQAASRRRLAGGGGECVAPEGHLARRLGGGGCNLFQEPIDLVRLTHSIFIVVAITVAFEQALHVVTYFLSHNSLHEYEKVRCLRGVVPLVCAAYILQPTLCSEHRAAWSESAACPARCLRRHI